jgi:hypothetical protein
MIGRRLEGCVVVVGNVLLKRVPRRNNHVPTDNPRRVMGSRHCWRGLSCELVRKATDDSSRWERDRQAVVKKLGDVNESFSARLYYILIECESHRGYFVSTSFRTRSELRRTRSETHRFSFDMTKRCQGKRSTSCYSSLLHVQGFATLAPAQGRAFAEAKASAGTTESTIPAFTQRTPPSETKER